MENYYFTVGKFCPNQFGYDYLGHGAKFLIVTGENYFDCENLVNKYAESIYGKREYKDLWYGIHAWTWNIIPYTKKIFVNTWKNRFDVILYNTKLAKSIFDKNQLNVTDIKEVYEEFLKINPIIEISKNEIKPFLGDLQEFIYGKSKQQNLIIDLIDPETIDVKETNMDKMFFN